ncbi:MAG: hypothetical protein RMY34_27760 [Aulosira sp. DedQUE10]|nr:hypothetical protein [Aulosira sp. DedQUE10]
MQPTQDLTFNHNQAVSDLETQISGVQFLKNFIGNNTSVLIDLKEHGELWTAVEEEIEMPLTVQFLIDEQGKKTAVLLYFEEHGEIWEDIYDSLIAKERVFETTVSLAEVKQLLIEHGKLSE